MIAAGVILLCYPKLAELREDAAQQKLASEWEKSFQNIEGYEEEQVSKAVGGIAEYDNVPKGTPAAVSTKPDDGEVEGMLSIDTIDLKLPILHGATLKHMKTSLASIEHTGKAGQIGNFAVAGHRSRTYGRNFNRLDELQPGDAIRVDTGSAIFEYTVTDKLVVKPEEVWVLEANGRDREITLVTCDPLVNPTHRLIIKGKMKSL
ncbi:class D sortase [Paenibacillus sp. XY044]|uniref:class D sortase n=1 Tax=Paenibacillus sp. XY044 TaxID=2026089 RepID=UPI000B99C005|nr:class D sortase [Paenibacillus sp. XY044]OZB90856.1 sortase [Paenibacillus sp. XY044]